MQISTDIRLVGPLIGQAFDKWHVDCFNGVQGEYSSDFDATLLAN
jgi:hypothetical protein